MNIHKFHKELDLAGRIQQGLLSFQNQSYELAGLTIAKQSLAANSIGGDFYLFGDPKQLPMQADESLPGVVHYGAESDTAISIVVGDVTGHGIGSALVMALCIALFSDIIKHTHNPSEILHLANQKLCALLPTDALYFVTAYVVTFFPRSQTIVYSQAGHPPGWLLSKTGGLEPLSCPNSFLGLYADEPFEEACHELSPGDRIMVYTDGLSEAPKTNGDRLSEAGLCDLFQQYIHQSLDDTLNAIFDAVKQKTTVIPDDQTLVLIESSPPHPQS